MPSAKTLLATAPKKLQAARTVPLKPAVSIGTPLAPARAAQPLASKPAIKPVVGTTVKPVTVAMDRANTGNAAASQPRTTSPVYTGGGRGSTVGAGGTVVSPNPTASTGGRGSAPAGNPYTVPTKVPVPKGKMGADNSGFKFDVDFNPIGKWGTDNDGIPDPHQAPGSLEEQTGLTPPTGVPNGPPWLNFYNPGAMTELYPEIKDALSGKTNSQGVADQAVDQLLEPTKSDEFSDKALEELGGDSETKKWVDANLSGLMETPFSDWWAMYGDQLGDKTMGELFAEGAIPGLEQPGFGETFTEGAIGDAYGNNPEIGKRAGEMYDELGNLIPNLPIDPNLDAYYNRAEGRASDKINTELAARGAYGSSGGLGMLSDAMVGLEAEKANREAQYGLDRAAELRGWQGLRGEMGTSADLNDVRASSEERLWLSNLMDAALKGDQTALARLGLAGDLAFKGSDTFLDRFGQRTEGEMAASDEDLARKEAGLGATQAVDETGLARAVGGARIAEGADSLEMNRAIAASNIAKNADQATLDQWMMIFRAAEGSFEEKIRTADLYFESNLAYGDRTGNVIGDVGDDVTNIDTAMTDAELAAYLGIYNEGVSGGVISKQMTDDDRRRMLDETANVFMLMQALKGQGGGGVMGGGAAGPSQIAPAGGR